MTGRRTPFWNPAWASVILGIAGVILLISLLNASMKDVVRPRPTTDSSAKTDFEAKTGRPDPGFRPDSASDYVDKMARETNGDWSKLSSDDKRYVNGLTAGHGEIYLRDRAKYLKATPRPTPSPRPSTR